MKSLHQDWLANVRNDLLAGLVVSTVTIRDGVWRFSGHAA